MKKEKPVIPGQFIVPMIYDRETPGTFVFISDNPVDVIPTLYIRKAAFKKSPPKTLHVSVTFI